MRSVLLAIFVVLAFTRPGLAQSATDSTPPKSWIDADTGHRVTRLTDEPNSRALYFNVNAFTPDGADMIYTAPGGLYLLHLATQQTSQLVEGKINDVVMGTRTRRVFYTKRGDGHVYVVNIDSKASSIVARLPLRGTISTVNADESLLAGTVVEGTAPEFQQYQIEESAKENHAALEALQSERANPGSGKNVRAEGQPTGKSIAIDERVAAKATEDLFVVKIQTGEVKNILQGKDWLNHVLFSPADPQLLMYAHEGHPDKVDRIWTIRADGSANQLIHTRSDATEIAWHEFWSHDGKTIWFDLQKPRAQNYFLAGYSVDSSSTIRYRLKSTDTSLHFSPSADNSMFCGDGWGSKADDSKVTPGTIPWSHQWIEVLYPIANDATNGANARFAGWLKFYTADAQAADPQTTGSFHSERLVNLNKNKYVTLEPNARFSPDNKFVIFSSNMFGSSYVFAVEVAKAQTPAVASGN